MTNQGYTNNENPPNPPMCDQPLSLVALSPHCQRHMHQSCHSTARTNHRWCYHSLPATNLIHDTHLHGPHRYACRASSSPVFDHGLHTHTTPVHPGTCCLHATTMSIRVSVNSRNDTPWYVREPHNHSLLPLNPNNRRTPPSCSR